jgi:hypothetical protein
MRTLYRCALLLLPLLSPSTLTAQQRGIEIGLDGGAQYAFDEHLLAILIPFQRVRAAFPSGPRLAFEPALALARISSGGSSLLAVAFEVGALYDLAASRTSTYARPFAGIEYGDTSASDAETVFDLGIGFGTRSRLADRLALRIEANLTGRFGQSGGADGMLGAAIGLSFFTR